MNEKKYIVLSEAFLENIGFGYSLSKARQENKTNGAVTRIFELGKEVKEPVTPVQCSQTSYFSS